MTGHLDRARQRTGDAPPVILVGGPHEEDTVSKQWGFRDTDRDGKDHRRGGREKGPRLFGRVNRDIKDSEIDAMVRDGLTEAQIMRKLGNVSPAERGKVSRRVSGKITKSRQAGKDGKK